MGKKKLRHRLKNCLTPEDNEQIFKESLLESFEEKPSSLFYFDYKGRELSTKKKKYFEKSCSFSNYTANSIARYSSKLRHLKHREASKKKSETENLNIWEQNSLSLKKNFLANQQKAPNTIVPESYQSINPITEDIQRQAILVASEEIARERKRDEMLRNQIAPMTTSLLNVLPASLVDRLTQHQREQVYWTYNQLIRYSESHLDKNLDVKCLLKRFCEQLYNGTSSEDLDELFSIIKKNSSIETVQYPEATFNKVTRKKTKPQRERFRRHLLQLKQIQKNKKMRQFRQSLDFIKEHIESIENKEIQKKAKKESKKLYEETQKKNNRFKIGKRSYEEPQLDLILPSLMEKTHGSLRLIRTSMIPGAAARDRIASIYRKHLCELPSKHPLKKISKERKIIIK